MFQESQMVSNDLQRCFKRSQGCFVETHSGGFQGRYKESQEDSEGFQKDLMRYQGRFTESHVGFRGS